jgi:hypothetical protein
MLKILVVGAALISQLISRTYSEGSRLHDGRLSVTPVGVDEGLVPLAVADGDVVVEGEGLW